MPPRQSRGNSHVISVLGGKGRFEGAKGGGTLSGGRLAPLATGADNYLDIVINVKK